MFENFTRYLLERQPFTETELRQIAGVSAMVTLQPGELLFAEGQLWPFNAFVSTGLLVNFTADGAGNEKVVGFAPEMFWAGDRNSLLTATAMPHSAKALEETYVVVIGHDELENLRFKIQHFNDMMNALIQKFIEFTTKNILDNMILADEEKYARLIFKIPTLPQRVPRALIASCLDISAEGLSRIVDGVPWEPQNK